MCTKKIVIISLISASLIVFPLSACGKLKPYKENLPSDNYGGPTIPYTNSNTTKPHNDNPNTQKLNPKNVPNGTPKTSWQF